MKRIILALTILLLPNIAEARKLKRVQSNTSWEVSNPAFTDNPFQAQSLPTPSRVRRAVSSSVQIIPHPSGCPRRAFCGCGAALAVFGEHRKDLWRAANWFKFPRASAASGMVAVRREHVFVLRSPASSGNWIVEDYNSGGRLSRIHERSLAGYTIVNPRG